MGPVHVAKWDALEGLRLQYPSQIQSMQPMLLESSDCPFLWLGQECSVSCAARLGEGVEKCLG